MQKILFVSIILLIGLFSLQWTLNSKGKSYYTSQPEPYLEVQPAQWQTTEWPYADYEVKEDSLGRLYLVKKEVQLSL